MPGCVATGRTPEEARQRMEEAIAMHVRGLIEDGLPVPEPGAVAEYVQVLEQGESY
ncbi:MAG: type II toxin-antitoxin system HicB family antitoxin [Clostridia bacterium]|nr:type II toxin-antitoxin system HicB family antitoxin [Clostridia bacterium]MDH7572212.1 type II toxin-antitoxin system HicB family antitoxin [Clostridia bacterium]